MTLPPLYLEGLRQRALIGGQQLNVYKLGLMEAILKETLRDDLWEDMSAARSAIETAVEVARWEMRPPRRPDTSTEDAP